MKHNTSVFILIAAILLFSQHFVYSQSYEEDTVWTKVTDQVQGFWKVKFSNNDSIIVGHGYGNPDPTTKFTLFYDALTGNEITRIPGNNEVFFFNNDLNFIKLNSQRNCFEIYDARNYLLIDTLENDGVKIYPYYDVSSNSDKLITIIQGGLRVYNLVDKRIQFSKQFPATTGLLKIIIGQIAYNCTNDKIILNIAKTYQISNSPPQQVEIINNTIFDTNTLDSINNFANFNDFSISRTCQYIAFKAGDPTNGVEIYDFNTKLLLHKLPINGPSLTGIEFSPDDKYIVTSNGPGADCLIVWDVLTGIKKYGYSETSFENIDISNSGKNIVFSVGRRIKLLKTKFDGVSVPTIPEIYKILYPNPTSGEVNINTSLKHIEAIKIYDIKGNEYSIPDWQESQDGLIQINVSPLTNGKYIIKIAGLNEVQSFNLIINR